MKSEDRDNDGRDDRNNDTAGTRSTMTNAKEGPKGQRWANIKPKAAQPQLVVLRGGGTCLKRRLRR
jgi:hypothetical protein